MLKKKLAAAFMLSASFLCGCAGGSPSAAQNEPQKEASSESKAPETSAQTAAAETAAAEAGTEPAPVSYPCLYTSEEMKCVYDGNEIYGKLYIPQNGRALHPAVILSHGYNCIGDDMKDAAEKLAENGVAAYTYDFRGGSTRTHSTGCTSAEMSVATEQDDLRHVIEMISSLDQCDEKQIYLYGESQGGFVSALTGAEMPDKIAGMFLVYPAFCIPDDWLGRDESSFTGDTFNFMGMDISKAFYDGVPRYDVFEHVSKFTNPVLIFHGDKDMVVNLSYSEKLVKAFPDAKLTVYEGGGHGFGAADRLMLKKAVAEYFTSNGLV